MDVRQTSLPDLAKLPLSEEASRFALEQATQYVTQSLQCYYSADARDEAFQGLLQEAAMRSHAGLLERAENDPELRGPRPGSDSITIMVGRSVPRSTG